MIDDSCLKLCESGVRCIRDLVGVFVPAMIVIFGSCEIL